MKNSFLILIAAAAFFSSSTFDKGTWLIDTDSELYIYGSTNVNNFTCKFDSYKGGDTLEFIEEHSSSTLKFSFNQMTIPVKSFDCGVKQISRDFWKTLKSESYPDLRINFRSLQNLNVRNNTWVDGVVDITLAGVTARYTINYHVTTNNKVISLKGTHPVNFSEFNLLAPEKLKGLIKVNECLEVEFNLVLKVV
jgi:hypothetical protein